MRPRTVCFDPLCALARHKSTAPDSIIRNSVHKWKLSDVYDAGSSSIGGNIDTSIYVDVKLLRHRVHILHSPLPLPITRDVDTSTINLQTSDTIPTMLHDSIIYDNRNSQVYGVYDTAYDFPSDGMCYVYTARTIERSIAALLTRFVRSYEISKFLIICTPYTPTHITTSSSTSNSSSDSNGGSSKSPLQGVFLRVLNSNYTASLLTTEASPHNSDLGPKPNNFSVSAPRLRTGVKLSYRVYTDTLCDSINISSSDSSDSNIHTLYSSKLWPNIAKVPLLYDDYTILLLLLQYRSTYMGNNEVFIHEKITCLFT